MKVNLISYTDNPDKVIASAAKLCYSNANDIDELMNNLTEEKIESFIHDLSMIGHESPFEHVSFTFGIEGISRACSHQIVRHRIASFSQQSQRYVDMSDFQFVIPPSIENNIVAKDVYQDCMDKITETYNALIDIMTIDKCKELYGDDIHYSDKERKTAQKMIQEDVRFVLPNACETRLILTMNVRSLYNFFKLRCCNRAQWEIRNVAIEMFKLVYNVSPLLFENAGPSCISKHVCSEGKMSCGNNDELLQIFHDIKKGVK